MSRNRIFVLYALLVVCALGAGLLVARALGPKAVLLTDYTTSEPVDGTAVSVEATAEITAGQQATATFASTSTTNAATETGVVETEAVPSATNTPPTVVPATEAPVAAEPTTVQAPGFVEYTIQRGDILKTIAEKYQVTIQDILAVNEIPNPDSLTVGSVIRIPRK